MASTQGQDVELLHGAKRLTARVFPGKSAVHALQHIELEDLFAARSWTLHLLMRPMKRGAKQSRTVGNQDVKQRDGWLLRSKFPSLCAVTFVAWLGLQPQLLIAQDMAGTPEEVGEAS